MSDTIPLSDITSPTQVLGGELTYPIVTEILSKIKGTISDHLIIDISESAKARTLIEILEDTSSFRLQTLEIYDGINKYVDITINETDYPHVYKVALFGYILDARIVIYATSTDEFSSPVILDLTSTSYYLKQTLARFKFNLDKLESFLLLKDD
jgi:hypothetical protein